VKGWLKIFLILIVLAVVQGTMVPRLNPYILQIINLIGINAIMAVSLNLITGFTGQFSLGHAGFMAIGAYSSAAVTVYLRVYFLNALHFLPFGLGETTFFLLALMFGGLLAALAGLLVGIPTLRLRGDYLAIATLGFGEIIRVVILNLDFIGGARGFGDIPEYANFFWIYAPLLFCVIFIYNLVTSPKGKALLAIREDEIASASIGINVTRYKVTAFLIGSFWAGIGGGLFAHLNTYLHTNSFGFMKSVEFVVMVVLGGMGSIVGSLAAAALLTVLPEALRVASEWRMIIYSLLLILLMILRPQGILGKVGKK
jgi:branched-chain amino acid transport system permease protein